MNAPLRIRRANPDRDAQVVERLMPTPVGEGLPSVTELWQEIHGYMDVLLGRVEPPIDSPYLSLMEVATAYYARAQEIDALIHHEENQMRVLRGSEYYKFRTGELRAFLELSKKAADLGSRRLSQEQILTEQRRSI
jgi:hypothetical protein